MCDELSAHLSALSFEERSDLTLSTDYIDKVFHTAEKESIEAPRRKFAIRALIEHFDQFGDASLRFFLIWRLAIGEGLSHAQVGEIMDVHQTTVTRILSKIREDDFSDAHEND